MAIELPKSRADLRPIQIAKRSIPLEQIVAVQGQNPVASGIDEAGKVIGQVLQQRAALQQQGKQLAALAGMAGETPPPADSGITPDIYEKGLALKTTHQQRLADAADKRTNLEFKLEQLKSGSTTVDPATGKTTTFPGVQGLSIQYDPAGNPFVARDTSYKPKEMPKIISPSGGSGGNFKNEADLRKEFEKESLDSKKSFQSASKALSLASRGDSIGDTSLAFALTKGALGGSGRITQTEIQQFGPQLGSLPDRIKNGILGLSEGKKFDDDVRAQIIDMVKQQANLEDQSQVEREQRYAGLASNYKFNPKNVVYDVRPPDLRSVLTPGRGTLQPLPIPGQSGGLSPAAQRLINKHK